MLVRNALFRRVRLAAADDHEALGEADVDNGFSVHKWRAALDEYYDVHEDVLVDADARSMAFLAIDESDEDSEHVWHVQQTFSDPDGDHDFAIRADVDLDATAWCSRTTASALSKTFCNSFFHCSLGKGGQLPFKAPSRCLERLA